MGCTAEQEGWAIERMQSLLHRTVAKTAQDRRITQVTLCNCCAVCATGWYARSGAGVRRTDGPSFVLTAATDKNAGFAAAALSVPN